jgi:hypothetical protein
MRGSLRLPVPRSPVPSTSQLAVTRRLAPQSPCPHIRPVAAAISGGADAQPPPLPSQPLAADAPAVEVEQQGEVALAYASTAALLAMLGAANLLVPGPLIHMTFHEAATPLTMGIARIVGAYTLLAAVCANRLKVRLTMDP